MDSTAAASRTMDSKIAMWLAFRALRWICWIAFFAICIYVRINRERPDLPQPVAAKRRNADLQRRLRGRVRGLL